MLRLSLSARRSIVRLTVSGGALALLAACASTTGGVGSSTRPASGTSPASSTGPSSSGRSSSAPGSSSAAPSALTVVVRGGSAGTQTWTLTCGPVGGTHPNAEAACAVLTAMGDQAFAPLPTGMMCTQIYGGPQTATVRGIWQGADVDASFSRTDGCQIGRWIAYQAVLVEKGSV